MFCTLELWFPVPRLCSDGQRELGFPCSFQKRCSPYIQTQEKLLEGLLCHPQRADGVQADGALSRGCHRVVWQRRPALRQGQDHPTMAKPPFAAFAACILARGAEEGDEAGEESGAQVS